MGRQSPLTVSFGTASQALRVTAGLRTLPDKNNRPDADIELAQIAGNVTLDVIAERRLELRANDNSTEVVVKLGRPVPDDDLGAWKCPYEVWFGDSCRQMAISGEDSMQALQLSIATLDMELRFGANRRGGVLYHLDEPFNSMLEDSGLQVKTAPGSAPKAGE